MNLHDAVERAVAAEPVDGTLLLQRVRAAERRSRRKTWTGGAAAVASAAAVLAVAVAVPSLLDQPTPPPPAAPAPAPDGQRAVSWHGVQLYVPETWKLHDARCGTAQSDTVLVPGPVNLCLPPYVPGLTVVEYRDGTEELPNAREVEVSGYRAFRGSVPLTEEEGVREVLVVPDLQVTVSVRSPDPRRADALLDTAQVVEVDSLGCPTALPSTKPPAPQVPGAAERVLPGEPVNVVLCQYGDLRLERSAPLPAPEIAALQSRLNEAPVGTSPSRVGTSVSAKLCPEYDRAPLVLLATYEDGSQLQIFTRFNSCTGPDPDNGARQVVVDRSVLNDLAQVLYGPFD
jgi:hypothetical protein